MKNKLLTISYLLCIHLGLWSQEVAKLTGTIHIEGAPALGAEVFMLNEENIATTADENGRYILENIPLGTQEIHFGYVSAVPVTKKVTITNTTNTLNINLKFDNQLNEVVVSGTLKPVTRMESPVPVEVYSPSFFKKNPTPNIYDALQNINGVRPQMNCGLCNTGDIRINGLEGVYTFVLIDGMPIVSGLSTVYGLSGIPNSLVERIEIVKGPASSLYGSEAVAGLVNIITKSSDESSKLSLDGFATSWGEFNLDASTRFKLGNASSILGINYFNYNQRIDNNNDDFTDMALQNRISIFNKWNFKRKSGKLFTLAGRTYYEDRFGGENQWTSANRGLDEVYGESIYTKRAELFGNYQLNTAEDLNLSFSANTHDQNSAYGTRIYNAEQHIGFGQLAWNKPIGDHHLLAGTAVKYTYYDDNSIATPEASEVLIPSIFVQGEAKLSEKSTLLAGNRLDYDNRHGLISTPRIAYKLGLTKNDVLRMNFGTGFRVVNLFTENHSAISGSREVIITEDLNPEESVNVNLNYLMKRYFKSGTSLSLETSLWYTYFSNKIIPDYETDVNSIIYANLDGYGVSQGVSLQGNLNLNNGLKFIAGATLQDVSNTDNDIKTAQILTENFNANLAVSYHLDAWNLDIDYTTNMYGPMRLPTLEFTNEDNVFIDDPRSKESPFWMNHNIQFTYKGIDNLEIYTGVKNIFNWTPADATPFVISRSNDPFEKIDNNTLLPFGPEYVYTSMQGIRGFLGVRYNLF